MTGKAASQDAGSFAGLRLGEFLDALGSGAAAPAAGSAAALVLAQAAALCAKAARLSAGQLGAGQAGRLTAEAERIVAEAVSLIDEDPRAYRAVLVAARDPAGELADALSAAADVPMRIAELAVPVAGLSATLAATAKPALRGDALTAGLLGQASASSAAALVSINLAGSPADPRHARARSLVAAVEEQLTPRH